MFLGIFKRVFFFFMLLASVRLNAQTVYINELCSSNSDIIADAEGDYSDWIELYNASSSAINLADWVLTDDKTEPVKWKFPSVQINAKSYLVIFASGKDSVFGGNEMHTNFKLSSVGEYLALLNSSSEPMTVFDPSFPQMNNGQSYGRFGETYVIFNEPTPGKANENTTTLLLPMPEFSNKHGFYNAPFNLQLSTTLADAHIYYTLDGSEPGVSSIKYKTPIEIARTSIIRAITINNSGAKSTVMTQTYLFADDVIHQSNTPEGYPDYWGDYTAISGKAIADYEMDPDMMANATKAQETIDALKELPVISIVSDKDNFFSNVFDEKTGGIYMYTGAPGDERGLGWERPVSMEYFDLNNTISLQVNCGIELHGGHSRRSEKSPKHSFRLKFSSDYGPSKLDFPFFGSEATDKFDYILLRAGFGYAWNHHSSDQRKKAQYTNDDWCKRTQLDMGDPASHSVFAHLYINGIYWGIYNANERLNKDFGETYIGGDADEYDVIKDYSEALDGTVDVWNTLIQKVNAGVESNAAYQNLLGRNADGSNNPNLQSYVDVENLINYMLINFYSSNSDWDHHNWVAMRNRVDPGKGFQFFCWDAECTLMGLNDNVLGEFNASCPSNIFQQLMKNDEFKRLFADKTLAYCTENGLLTPAVVRERWLYASDQIEKAIDAESARWGDYRRDVHNYSTGPYELYTKEDFWIPQHNWMLNTYFPSRTDIFLRQLRSAGFFPNVDAPSFFVNGTAINTKNVIAGDVLTMTTPQGVIYYTTTGEDPVVWENSTSTGENFQLVYNNATKYVLVPGSDIGNDWYSKADIDLTGWHEVTGDPGGVGYEAGTGYASYISYDVKDQMYSSGSNPNTSCYIRIPFSVNADQLSKITTLNLLMRYDDGFVAYLNGVKIASSSAPDAPAWNSVSTAGNESTDVVSYTISDKVSLLKEGDNLLAIQGLNQKVSSSDFLIMAALDGSSSSLDKRLSENVKIYSGSIALSNSVDIKARTYNNGEWSAMKSQLLQISDDLFDLKITEINYHPLPEGEIVGDFFEFVELKNIGESSIDLSKCKFIDGIDYEFNANTTLNPSAFMVLASSNSDFFNRYGFWPDGQYSGQLDNSGEQLVLANEAGDTLISLIYDDKNGWPEMPDGNGYTLVPVNINPVGNQNDKELWRASYYINGSPGADDILRTGYDELADFNQDKEPLFYNYPNPFNSQTSITYSLTSDADVKIDVLNMAGAEIAVLVNGRISKGNYMVGWDVNSPRYSILPEGIYLCRMQIITSKGNDIRIRKMLLMR